MKKTKNEHKNCKKKKVKKTEFTQMETEQSKSNQHKRDKNFTKLLEVLTTQKEESSEEKSINGEIKTQVKDGNLFKNEDTKKYFNKVKNKLFRIC